MTTAITKNEAWTSLIEELRDCIITFRDESAARLIELKHKVGELIVTSTYYKKHGKQNLLLIEKIAGELGMSTTNIRYCVQFYQKHPLLSPLVESANPGHYRLTWTDIKESLSGPKEEETDKCHHVWKCTICGLVK